MKIINIKNWLVFTVFCVFFSVLPLSSESEKHIMWEAVNKEAKVYLLGSIHMARPDVYPLDTVLTNAFKRSDYLVVEVDMNKADIFSIMKKAYYKDGGYLRDNLSEETYSVLQEEFSKLDIKEPFYEKMKPWFAVMTLLNLKLTGEGYDASQGIDMFFMDKAIEADKPILELESDEFQITLFDSIISEMQEDFVLYSLSDFDSSDSYVDEMFEYWKSGDAAGLERLAFEQYEDMPNADEFEKAFLYDRNANMILKIIEYLNTDKTYFVVVGAAHLLGDKGIIQLLKEKNYHLEQR